MNRLPLLKLPRPVYPVPAKSGCAVPGLDTVASLRAEVREAAAAARNRRRSPSVQQREGR